MPFDEFISLERQLKNKRDNLLLLQERMSQYPLDTDIPLELVREEREHQAEIASLEKRIAQVTAERGAQVFPARPASAIPNWVWLPALGVILAVVAIATLWLTTARPGTAARATQTAAAGQATATLSTLLTTATPEPSPPYPYPALPSPEGVTPEGPTPAAPTLPPDLTVAELEPMLQEVNIILASTGSEDDFAAMRSYFEGPDSAYYMLAVACLRVLHGHHLKQTGYLDILDEHYTRLRGGEDHYLNEEGEIDDETLREAILAAHNDYYGDNAASFDELIAPGANP